MRGRSVIGSSCREGTEYTLVQYERVCSICRQREMGLQLLQEVLSPTIHSLIRKFISLKCILSLHENVILVLALQCENSVSSSFAALKMDNEGMQEQETVKVLWRGVQCSRSWVIWPSFIDD